VVPNSQNRLSRRQQVFVDGVVHHRCLIDNDEVAFDLFSTLPLPARDRLRLGMHEGPVQQRVDRLNFVSEPRCKRCHFLAKNRRRLPCVCAEGGLNRGAVEVVSKYGNKRALACSGVPAKSEDVAFHVPRYDDFCRPTHDLSKDRSLLRAEVNCVECCR